MAAFRESNVMLEVFWLRPFPKKGKKQQQQHLGPVRASSACVFCVALMQLAGLRSSTVMHQMVQKISCCSFSLPKSSVCLDASKGICRNSWVLRLISNTSQTWVFSLHRLTPAAFMPRLLSFPHQNNVTSFAFSFQHN